MSVQVHLHWRESVKIFYIYIYFNFFIFYWFSPYFSIKYWIYNSTELFLTHYLVHTRALFIALPAHAYCASRARLAVQRDRVLSPPTQPVRDYVPCFGNFIYGTRVLDVLSGFTTLSPITMSNLVGLSRASVFKPKADDPSWFICLSIWDPNGLHLKWHSALKWRCLHNKLKRRYETNG